MRLQRLSKSSESLLSLEPCLGGNTMWLSGRNKVSIKSLVSIMMDGKRFPSISLSL